MLARRLAFFVILLGVYARASVAQCTTPATPVFTFVPPVPVAVGQTWTVQWTESPGLAGEGYYEVERYNVTTGSVFVDRQIVDLPAASFLVSGEPGKREGQYQVRVRAVPLCNAALASPFATSPIVSINRGKASVVFTVQPKPLIVNVGESLAGKKAGFVLENLTSRTINGIGLFAAPFAGGASFQVIDPAGGDLSNIALQPGTPKAFDIEFIATSTSTAAAYQGFIFLTAPAGGDDEAFAVTPYAFVNLKIGAADSVAPEFTINGIPTEYAFFPGFAAAQPDTSRPPLTIGIRNPGSSPLELGAEVGPELWVAPRPGWNAEAIAAGATASVDLLTDRIKAPSQSLPRYTYFTVTSKTGKSARLLVQDNDAASVSSTRARLDDMARSFTIPEVTSKALAGGADLYSRIRMSNNSGAQINAEILFTPTDGDGFDTARVKRAVVIVPPNDEISLSDPLQLIYGLSRPATGQMEIRPLSETGASRFGNLSVTSTIFTSTPDAKGGFFIRVPVAIRGEGARVGEPHVVPGLTVAAGSIASLVLAETSGGASVAGAITNSGQAAVKVQLYDANGTLLGSRDLALAAYGQARIENVLTSLGGGSSITGGRIQISVDGGGGSVLGLLLITENGTGRGWSVPSEPASGESLGKLFARHPQQVHWPQAMTSRQSSATSAKFVVPSVVSGLISALQSYSYRTSVQFAAPASAPATFTASLAAPTGATIGTPKIVVVSAGRTVSYPDVMKDLFGILEALNATMFVESSNPGGKVIARLEGATAGSSAYSLAGTIPVVPTVSQAASGFAGAARPVYMEGLEQSIDASRGSRWIVVINEIANASATVLVRVYEAGNRVLPIAEKQYSISPLQTLRFDSIFTELQLDTDIRRKDRSNVMVVVQAISGSGLVTATALAQDNRTGSAESYLLSPTGGIPASMASLAAPVPREVPPVIRVVPREPRDPVRLPPGALP